MSCKKILLFFVLILCMELPIQPMESSKKASADLLKIGGSFFAGALCAYYAFKKPASVAKIDIVSNDTLNSQKSCNCKEEIAKIKKNKEELEKENDKLKKENKEFLKLASFFNKVQNITYFNSGKKSIQNILIESGLNKEYRAETATLDNSTLVLAKIVKIEQK
jgi:hypothetical protein